MGILEDLLAGAVSGGAMGGRPQPRSGGAGGLGGSGALAALLPIVIAMLANRQRGAGGGLGGGGLGDLLGQALGGGRGAGAGGGLGDILGQVLGGGAGGGAPGGAGGLGGLLEQLGRGGLTQQAQSWVGAGQNMSVSSGQIRDVFGQRGLSAIAQQSGLSEDEASEGLAQLLPEIVNHLTPQGRMPQGEELDSALEGLMRQLVR